MLIRRLGGAVRLLVLPHGLVAVGGTVFLVRDAIPPDPVPSFSLVLYTLAAATAALGLRFHRSRVVLAAGLLAAAHGVLSSLPDGQPGHVKLLAVWVLVPLLLATVALFPERGLGNRYGLAQVLLLASPVIAAAYAVREHPEWLLRLLEPPFLPYVPDRAPELSHSVLVSFALGLLIVSSRFVHRRTPVDAGLFWVLATLSSGYLHHTLDRTAATGELAGWFALGCFILLLSLLESFHFLAFRDELTGLPGRRALNQAMNSLGRRYTLAMVDIDHFKKVNDRHGHDVGDQVLRMVAARLTAAGTGARIYRYGGEEFTAVLSGKAIDEALPQLETLRATVATTPFRVRGPLRLRSKRSRGRKTSTAKKTKSLQITVSIGAASASAGEDPSGALKRADQALYRAKKNGRNRVCKVGSV